MDPTEMAKYMENTTRVTRLNQECSIWYVNKSFKKLDVMMFGYGCDVKLKVGDQNFMVHRDVLAEASDYFSAMFSVEMREKDQKVIELQGISKVGCSLMIEYIYHGCLTLNLQNVKGILEAARFFHVEWMIAVCQDFLVTCLSLYDYELTLQLADQFCLGDLHSDITRHIGLNFNSISNQPKLLLLSAELLETILTSDSYIGATEYCIMTSIMKWVNHDPEERGQHLIPFLLTVRYPLFTTNEIEKIPEEILSLEELKDAINDAKEYHENPSGQSLVVSESTRARGSEELIAMIATFEEMNALQYKIPGIEGFFSEEIQIDFMSSTLEFANIAVFGNFLYVAGGYDRETYCSSTAFYRFDPRIKSWAELTSMSDPRVSFSLIVDEFGLYAIGGIDHHVADGLDKEDILDSVEFYNPQGNDWRAIASLPYGYYDSACSYHQGVLYMSGGISDNPSDDIPTSHLLKCDLQVNESDWVPCSPMLTARNCHSMTALDNKLYVFGGKTSESMANVDCLLNEVYDIETDQWTQIMKTPEDLLYINAASVVFDGQIYLLSGKYVSRFLHSYDPEKDEISQGEYCGSHIKKLAQMSIPFPHTE